MEARYLILARYAEFSPGDSKLTVIGGDMDQIVADAYPHVHPMLLVATKLIFERADSGREHPFRAVIVDKESGDIVAEGAKGTIPEILFPEEVERLGSGLILPFADVIFNREGRYEVQLIVEDIVLAKTSFRVAPFSYYQKRAASIQEALQRKLNDGSHDSNPDQ
jgi:hypothetical protein